MEESQSQTTRVTQIEVRLICIKKSIFMNREMKED